MWTKWEVMYYVAMIATIIITKLCPAVIRLDRGSENVKIAAVHYAFRESHTDQLSGEKSFIFGSSPGENLSYLLSTEN